MELGDAEFREVAPGVLAALVDAGVGEVKAEVGDLAGLVRRVEKPFDVALNSEETVGIIDTASLGRPCRV